jgi:acyl-CoA reductase-like NAD-dependent aldehyde dehydrogenase
MAVVEHIESPGGERGRPQFRGPVTPDPVGEIEVPAADDVYAAVEMARKAQPDWAGLSCEERAIYVKRAVRVLVESREEFVDVIAADTGKPRLEVFTSELLPVCDVATFYAKRAKRILADRRLRLRSTRRKRLRICYQPLGVVGIITPWSLPFALSMIPTVQALLAGNTVVLKPSEGTPLAGGLVERVFEAVGLPSGVFKLVHGDGETAAALVESSVDKIHFTGSAGTGHKVAEACGRLLKPCTLQLAGKDPMIVCADADLDRAAAGAVWGAFANSGQAGMSTERVYVVDEVADAFIAKVLKKTAELRQGIGGDFEIGPIIWPPQLEVIERQVAEALEGGAVLRAGGRRNPSCDGFYYEPTVLTDVTQDMSVVRDETLGPVMPIMRVRDEDEAQRLVNDSRHGFNANVWTKNKHKGVEIAKALESGNVFVNDCTLTCGVTELLFGGTKKSGIGRVNGEQALWTYCHTRSIVVDRFGSGAEAVWYPYTQGKLKRFQRAMRFVWGTPLGRFLS